MTDGHDESKKGKMKRLKGKQTIATSVQSFVLGRCWSFEGLTDRTFSGSHYNRTTCKQRSSNHCFELGQMHMTDMNQMYFFSLYIPNQLCCKDTQACTYYFIYVENSNILLYNNCDCPLVVYPNGSPIPQKIHWGQDAAKLGKMAFQTLQTQLENEAGTRDLTKGVMNKTKLLYKV